MYGCEILEHKRECMRLYLHGSGERVINRDDHRSPRKISAESIPVIITWARRFSVPKKK